MLPPFGFLCDRLDGPLFVLLVGRTRGCAGSYDGSTGVDVLEDLPFGVGFDVCECGTGRSPVSTDSAGFASESSRLLFIGAGILDAASFSISLLWASIPTLPVALTTPGSAFPGVSLEIGLPSKALSTPRPALERASPRVDPGPGNVLSFATRVEAEDEGLIRPLVDCVAFCGAREDCGRLAVDVGLVAFRGALNAPTRGDGASAGDSIAELPVGFLFVLMLTSNANGQLMGLIQNIPLARSSRIRVGRTRPLLCRI